MNQNHIYQNILVLDIETVSSTEKFEQLPERLKPLWQNKANFIKNEEEFTVEELYFKKGAIYAEFGKIVCISAGFFHRLESGEYQFRVTSFASHDEKKLLLNFIGSLEKMNQRELRFVAHNGKEFDYPYLCRRMLVNDIPLPISLQLSDKKPWEIKHMDTMNMWKFGDMKNYTSLELLTALFGIESSKQGIDGSMVNDVYYKEEDLDKIAEYCTADVIVTAQLYLKLNQAPIIEEKNIVIV